jgi:hypothetical protein
VQPALGAPALATQRAQSLVLNAAPANFVLSAPAVCDAATFEGQSASFPETVCANRQFPGASAQPWAGPQPGSNPCPVCVLVPAEKLLYVSLDPAFVALTLESATLQVGDSYLALDVGALTQSPTVRIDGVDVGTDPIETATLLFKVKTATKDFSTESQLIIKQ